MAIELISRPPFIRVMPSKSFPMNGRLTITVYFGRSGSPKRYLVAKTHGRAGGLAGSDTLLSIGFPAPDSSFRRILGRNPHEVRVGLGRYTWSWAKDGGVLYAYDDMTFFFTRDEAKLLDELLFGKQT